MTPSDRDSFEAHVLDHYEDPYHRGPLGEATHAFEGDIPICGDSIRIELKVSSRGVVDEAWFDGDGCIASQASASMLVERVEGMSTDEIRAFSANEMLALFGPKLTPDRQKCCLLGWRVLQSALQSPLQEDPTEDVGDDEGRSFGGPSLSEEC